MIQKFRIIERFHNQKLKCYDLFNLLVVCNLCGHRCRKFDSDNWHLYTICPNCSSQVRHRLLWAALNHINQLTTDVLIKNKSVLHFSPYYIVAERLKPIAKKYVMADYFEGGYDFRNMDMNLDISDMKDIEDASFDCLIAVDVLEHVIDHLRALKEINRILKMGGYCILIVPQKDNLKITEEDLTIKDPKIREMKYGQTDHLRMYGLDFKQMIENNGFEVTVVDEQYFSKRHLRRNVLFPPILSDNPIATNFRKVHFGKKIKPVPLTVEMLST